MNARCAYIALLTLGALVFWVMKLDDKLCL